MAQPLISFQDAVTASNLDPNQTHAVYYADGAYANRTAVAARCPRAKLYGITVRGATGAGIFAVDSETGDLDVPSTLRWVEQQINLKVRLIVVYANKSRWENEGLLTGVQALEKKYGVKVRKWVAWFNNVPEVLPWADAEQYANPGPIDRNVALANFFGDAPAPAPEPKPHGVAHLLLSFDLATDEWTLRHLPGLVHWQKDEKWASIEVQLGVGGKITGQWRAHPLDWNAKPLGS